MMLMVCHIHNKGLLKVLNFDVIADTEIWVESSNDLSSQLSFGKPYEVLVTQL